MDSGQERNGSGEGLHAASSSSNAPPGQSKSRVEYVEPFTIQTVMKLRLTSGQTKPSSR
jgi:hypothetical protein